MELSPRELFKTLISVQSIGISLLASNLLSWITPLMRRPAVETDRAGASSAKPLF
jgi:hypothetical protein